MNYELLALVAVVALVIGWFAARMYAKNAPTERALVIKAAAAVTKRIAAMQSTAPEAAIEAAAQAAAEATAIQQFKDAAASLK